MELGDRMKRYAAVSDHRLMRRTPVIARIDGRAFHTFTKGLPRPFCLQFQIAMLEVAKSLCQGIDGCKLAYVQSDEINLLITDYETFETEAWFDYRINKICSVAAGIASNEMRLQAEAMDIMGFAVDSSKAIFDARFFNVPKEDVANYFVWRQRDAVKNSINMHAQSMFVHDSLQYMNGNQLQELMWQTHKFNWNDAPTINKRGAAVLRNSDGEWRIDWEIPEFSKSRHYIDTLLLDAEERERIRNINLMAEQIETVQETAQ